MPRRFREACIRSDILYTVGGTAGFDPHPLFDGAWYLSQHPELRERRQNPLIHYLTEGWWQGTSPHPQFDGDLYLTWNPDVKAAGVNPLYDFARYGQAEGRAQPMLKEMFPSRDGNCCVR